MKRRNDELLEEGEKGWKEFACWQRRHVNFRERILSQSLIMWSAESLIRLNSLTQILQAYAAIDSITVKKS